MGRSSVERYVKMALERRMTLNKLKKVLGILVLVGVIMFGQIGMNSQAASQLSGTFDHSYWFSIPEGGHASCSVEVTYREYYTYNGKRYVFNRRTKTYMMNVAGATTVPYIKMGNSKHLKSDGTTIKTFSTWTKEAGIYDGSKWNRYDSYVNTGSKKYKRATKAKVNYPFWVCCTGAVIPTYSGSISFALKTK